MKNKNEIFTKPFNNAVFQIVRNDNSLSKCSHCQNEYFQNIEGTTSCSNCKTEKKTEVVKEYSFAERHEFQQRHGE